jgi:hypothetical protein
MPSFRFAIEQIEGLAELDTGAGNQLLERRLASDSGSFRRSLPFR